MSYFNLNIDNDITYLFGEIGHNVLINDVNAKAIINNSSMERTFDDKKIITHEELKRGQYIYYNDLYFILLNEVNDKRFLSYYKGIMRRCNFNIQFVIDGKLYLFYSIIESDKFNINESKLINTLANAMTVTLPLTDITKTIKEGTRFIQFGKGFEVQGIDYTQHGLIKLHCEVDAINPNTDDLENEIANRYDGIDLLDGNIEPIKPFGTELPPTEPTEPEPEEPPLEDNFTIVIEGQDNINRVNSGTYVAKILNNGIEVEGKEVTFTLSNTLAFFGTQTGNTIVVKANENWKYGQVILKATLIDDETMFAEKTINVTGL